MVSGILLQQGALGDLRDSGPIYLVHSVGVCRWKSHVFRVLHRVTQQFSLSQLSGSFNSAMCNNLIITAVNLAVKLTAVKQK